MEHNLYEKAELYLYGNFSKEFKVNNKKELKSSKKEKLKNDINDYIKNEYEQKGVKSFCFIQIKYKDKIIDIDRQVFKRDNSIFIKLKKILQIKSALTLLKNRIDKKIDSIEDTHLEDISFKVFIIENTKSNRHIFIKLKKEFCSLEKQLETQENEKQFLSYIFDNKLYILSFGTIALTLTLIYRLSELGILMNFLSIDTLTLIINITIYFIGIGILLMLFLTFIYILGLIFLENFLSKIYCHHLKLTPLNIFKEISSICLVLYMFIVVILIGNDLIKDYKSSYISDDLIKDYIIQTREPSLREIKYKDKDKMILLMGKDNKFISYIYTDDIKNKIGTKIQEKICKNETINESYVDSIIALLNIKQNIEDKDQESKQNFIANRRYRVLKISDIEISEKIPSFAEIFCNENNKNLEEKK